MIPVARIGNEARLILKLAKEGRMKVVGCPKCGDTTNWRTDPWRGLLVCRSCGVETPIGEAFVMKE